MGLLARLLLTGALIWLAVVMFWELRAQQQAPDADQSQLLVSFGALIIIGLAIALIIVFSVLPAVAEWVGNFFYAPDQPIEKDPHAPAMAKIAQGDFAGAIAEYHAIFERDPSDVSALSEMARIYCERLGDPESGAAILEETLERELPAEQVSFIANRLVDIYWHYQHDATRARALLTQIAEALPGTRHAANAQRRMEEIQRAITRGELPALPESSG